MYLFCISCKLIVATIKVPTLVCDICGWIDSWERYRVQYSQICNKIKLFVVNIPIYKVKFYYFQVEIVILKFKLINILSLKFMQNGIIFTNIEFRIKSPIFCPKTLCSSTLYPTQYKFHSANCPCPHSHILTLLIVTMTLTAAAINLCHTVYWNF